MDRFDDEAKGFFQGVAGLALFKATKSIEDVAAWGRKLYAEGLAEGEAKRAFLVSLIRQVSEFKDIDWDNDSILAYEAEAYQKHLLQEAEAKLARVENHLASDKQTIKELETKLYDTEVKRGQDIMEFEREKKALNAELAKLRKV